MAFFNSNKFKPVRPEQLEEALLNLFPQEVQQRGLASKPGSSMEDSNLIAAGFFRDMMTKRNEKSQQAKQAIMEQLARESADEAARLRKAMDVTRSLGSEDAAVRGALGDPTAGNAIMQQSLRDEGITEALSIEETVKTMEESIQNVVKGIVDTPEPDAATGGVASDGKEPKGIMSRKLDGKDGDATVFETPEYKVYKSPDQMSELEILARTIEAEAASEAYEGKIAVGATIANRAASGKYGKGIKGVILRKGQFSPWNSWTGYAKGEQGRDMMSLKASKESYKAANAILTGNYEDPTDGSVHYVNEKISTPDWLDDMKKRKRGTVVIGNHLFGNADSDKKYDGKDWIKNYLNSKARPE